MTVDIKEVGRIY